MPKKHHESHPAQPARQIRCFTRAVKNVRYLQQHDPANFAKGHRGPGLGTGLPVEILHRLHLLGPDAPELAPYPAVSEFLKRHPMPKIRKWTKIGGHQQ
jgi:hypothetical protein